MALGQNLTPYGREGISVENCATGSGMRTGIFRVVHISEETEGSIIIEIINNMTFDLSIILNASKSVEKCRKFGPKTLRFKHGSEKKSRITRVNNFE